MIIDMLRLQNFRKFEDVPCIFNPNFTVLIGDNATGKTSILDAISIMLSSYILDFGFTGSPRHLQQNDVRFVVYEMEEIVNREKQFPTVIYAEIKLERKTHKITRELRKRGGRTTWVDARSLKSAGKGHLTQVKKNEQVDLPLIAYYGTGRLWHMKRHTEKFKPTSRINAYVNCLDPNSDHLEFQKWFEAQETVAIQKRKVIPALESVRNAVKICIPKCKEFFFDTQYSNIAVNFEDDEYCPFDNLSDGFKNMVAMVADIAHRAARLNPHFGENAAKNTSGIVLIDEVDLHLHPKWQRRVINDLRTAFPNIQFIVTTHSPFIIQSLNKGEVIDLNKMEQYLQPSIEVRNFADPAPDGEFSNKTIEDIAEDVMGISIPQRSKKYQDMYETAKKYYELLQNAGNKNTQEREELKKKLDKLSAPFSDNVAYHAFLELRRHLAGLGSGLSEDE